MRSILYIGRFGLPDTAPGLRVYNVAKALLILEYHTVFISTMGTHRRQVESTEYGGHKYIFTNRSGYRSAFLRTAANLFELLTARKAYRAVRNFCQEEKPDGIILYNDLYPLTKKLIKFCSQNSIRVYADVTEWYEKRKYHKLGDFIIPYWTDKRIRKLDRKLNGIIAISKYLSDYYNSIGCNNVICVPPLFEMEKNMEIRRHPYDGIQTVNLVYAGSPGSKDILTPVFDALEVVNRDSVRVRLDVVGLNEDQIQKLWKKTVFQSRGIYAHGRLSHADTLQIVCNADFGILLREDKRYAKAGYSTKFAECMTVGVAMICNKLGGTDTNISDGYNGFLLDSYSVEDIIQLLNCLCDMDNQTLITIKNNAYHFALSNYQMFNYTKSLMSLFVGD